MLFVFLVIITLGLGTIIRNLIELRKQNDIIIEILDNIYSDTHDNDKDL